MKVKYNIEKIEIKQTKQRHFLIVSGWCFSLQNDNFSYQVVINGEIMQFDFFGFPRQDVWVEYTNNKPDVNCGFRIYVDLTKISKIEEVKVMVRSDKGSFTIFEASGNQVAKIIDTGTIEYAIDKIQKSIELDKLVIQGWALSLENGESIDYIILDNNNEVEYEIKKLHRNDLVMLRLSQEQENNCGFSITFTGDSFVNKTLVLSNKIDTIKIDLNMTQVKPSQFKRLLTAPKQFNKRNLKKGFRYIRKHGLLALLKRLIRGRKSSDLYYHHWFLNQQATKEQLKIQSETSFDYQPMFSIIVPTYNTPERFLREMIDSVLNQSYSNLQLCIADGSENNDTVEKVVFEYMETDKRIVFKKLEKNLGISGNTNEALKLATGEYVGLFDHDDLLTPDALFEICSALQKKKHDILYTDEDKVNSDGDRFADPNLKPDFSMDLFYSHNYITHFFVVRKSILDNVGGFRQEYDGAQDYDVMFRCIEQANSIYHVPKVLYHWRMHSNSTAEDPTSKLYCYEAGKKAIEDHYKRVGIKATVEMMDQWGLYHSVYDTSNNPLVSVIIPNKDHKEILETCINSLYENNDYKNFEIIIAENNSTDSTTFEYYDFLEKTRDNIKVVKWNDVFNYAAINNFAVSYANGEYLLFLNNDTEVINKTALSELVGTCMRDEVGIVGAKLLYDDDTVQHAGVVIGFGGFAGHVFHGIGKDAEGYMMRALINCNYSAVTAACMLVDKKAFEAVHGFDERFVVALNDIDFCLQVRAKGYTVVYNAHSLWYHYESKSRGYEDTPEKQERFEREIKLFQEKWKNILAEGDPYYNKNFKVTNAPFVLA